MPPLSLAHLSPGARSLPRPALALSRVSLCLPSLLQAARAEEGVLQEELPQGGGDRAAGGVEPRRRQPGARRQVPPHVLPRLLRQGNTAEKNAAPNLSLAGFEVIEEVKAAVERECAGVVSCADIVALAARDSVSYQYRRSLWEVETGRRDGTVSSDQEALADIPAPTSTFPILLANFSAKGLGLQDLVVLSGGHTIGIGHCNLFSSRLFNFTGKNNPSDVDPSLNPSYARFLQGQCRRNQQDPNDNSTVVPMDPGSSVSFDSHYFVNLKARQGMFTSDATLLTDGRAAALVDKLRDPGVFLDHFKNSIKRMGQIGVLTGAAGQIRKRCNAVNS
ncbi:putative cationic peroxidase isozyme 38K precursor [Oryza sativa Japonica Group]|uniref:Peroxidase n=1 Tax=Oryza sativa subsp. japonica TaxID=39947 RepID=Q5ZDE7_ORYSJ|nr:putative cationic peroxidase isozyme 38K precursor [Oryza sativa Japonica Group]